MDRDEALRELPTAYAVALRLRGAPEGEALIVRALGVAPEAVGPLLEVAEAKLEAVLAGADAGDPDRLSRSR